MSGTAGGWSLELAASACVTKHFACISGGSSNSFEDLSLFVLNSSEKCGEVSKAKTDALVSFHEISEPTFSELN